MGVLSSLLRSPDRAADAVVDIHGQLAESGADLPVRRWDGTELGPDDAGWRLVLHHPWSLRALVGDGTDLAAGTAYVTGAVEVEGSMVAALRAVADLDLDGGRRGRVLRAALRLPPPPRDHPAVGRAARLRGRRHSTRRDQAAVQHHYDVGNDFYRLFLDRGLVYSCAYFADADEGRADALERAQVRKLDLVCRKLALRPGERLLDIGCGWGSLVLHAAEHYGVHAVGVTLSEEQAALARERVAAAELGDRIEIRLQDEREVTGTFDAVASVGMVEHVGSERLAAYLRHCYELTSPDGGRLLNHGITTGRRDEIRDLGRARDRGFVGSYVFPDGALVPAHAMVAHVQRAGFELIDVEQLRPHYERTLEHWTARLEARFEEAVAAVGETIARTWRAYLAGSSVGFRSGDLGVIQILGVRDASLPRGRGWMLPRLPA